MTRSLLFAALVVVLLAVVQQSSAFGAKARPLTIAWVPPRDTPGSHLTDNPSSDLPEVRAHRWRGVAAVTLSSGALEATFIPELNLLGTSLRFHGEEFLALPGGLDAYRGLHTTGLPLLHPWANRLRAWAYSSGRTRVDLHGLDLHTDGRGHPIHGTMSARDEWSVTELAVRGRIARLRASFDYERPDLLAAFPFPHNLGVTIDVDGVGVSIATTVESKASTKLSFDQL